MKKHLLPEGGSFYKANMHTHTNISDGQFSPEEIKRLYMEKGYSIVAYTDHEVLVPQNHLTDDNFLAINSVEVAKNDGWHGGFEYNKTYHINFYAKDPGVTECPVLSAKAVWLEQSRQYITEGMEKHPYKSHYSIAGINDMIKKANDAGFLVCLNHPVWSCQDYTDYMGLKGLWGIEVYNTGCFRGGMPDTVQPMVDLLRTDERVMPVAADDVHGLGAAFGGWLMVKADRLEYGIVMNALERGDFYASTGPEIKELYLEDGKLHVTTSEAASVQLMANYRYSRAKNGSAEAPVTEACFDIASFFEKNGEHAYPRSTPWFRLEVRDLSGNMAWTRAYFIDELR